jgi:hypothetical protein
MLVSIPGVHGATGNVSDKVRPRAKPASPLENKKKGRKEERGEAASSDGFFGPRPSAPPAGRIASLRISALR